MSLRLYSISIFRLLFPFALLLLGSSAKAATLSPGDLIKASGPSVYYYADNGKRYVFPTEKTYFTWYQDFSSVKTITDAELGALTIGGNLTYRPGVKLVKITTDPKVYAIGPGKQLRWIKTEALATALYGSDWAKKIDDIPDPFFINYTLGSEVATSTDYFPGSEVAAHTTIQSTLVTSIPAPTPTPAPAPTPAPPPSGGPTSTGGISLMVSKETAQAGDFETLIASASHTSGIAKIDLFFDNQLIQTCSTPTCSGETQIPISGTKNSYEAKAVASALDTTTLTKTQSVAIQSGVSGLVKLAIGRSIIRQNASGEAIVTIDASIAILRTDIYLNGFSKKACASASRECRWTDLLTDQVGTVYQVYGQVTDTLGRTYKSETKTITIGTNDSPIVSIAMGKTSILKGETVDVTVTASDDDGMATIDILQNGNVLKTCQGAQPCTAVTGPWNEVGVLTFKGRAKDGLGLQIDTESVTVTVK